MHTITDPLSTYSGTPLPSLAEAAQAETVAEGEANEAEVAALLDPTPETLEAARVATIRHIETKHVLAACYARLVPGRVA